VSDENEAALFDETPEQAERAILNGLRYLEREALAMKLRRLAAAIRRSVSAYHRPTGGSQ